MPCNIILLLIFAETTTTGKKHVFRKWFSREHSPLYLHTSWTSGFYLLAFKGSSWWVYFSNFSFFNAWTYVYSLTACKSYSRILSPSDCYIYSFNSQCFKHNFIICNCCNCHFHIIHTCSFITGGMCPGGWE